MIRVLCKEDWSFGHGHGLWGFGLMIVMEEWCVP